MANVSYKLKDLEKRTIKIGYVGENDHMHVLIDCKEAFDEYPNAVATMAIVPPEGEDYPKAVTRNGNIVEWLVKNSDVAAEGDGEFQLTFTEDNVVKKSVTGRFSVERSISGNGTAPSGIDDWLTDANEKLAEVEAATQEAEDAASHAPRVGTSGYWEVWNAEQGQYVATSTKAQGEPGEPGSPGDPTQLIDDQAGQGVTGKTWSADKLNDQFGDVLNAIGGKQDAPSTAGTSGQVLSLDSNLHPKWVSPSTASIEDGSVTMEKLAADVANEIQDVGDIFGVSDWTKAIKKNETIYLGYNQDFQYSVASNTRVAIRPIYIKKGDRARVIAKGFDKYAYALSSDGIKISDGSGSFISASEIDKTYSGPLYFRLAFAYTNNENISPDDVSISVNIESEIRKVEATAEGFIVKADTDNIGNNIITTYKDMYVRNNNGVIQLSKNKGQTWNNGFDATSLGLIKSCHLFANGCIAIFTHQHAYYSEDWTTYHEASVYEKDGVTPYSPSTYDNFFFSRDNQERKFIGEQDLHVFGNYGITDENNTRRIIWLSVDNGHTYKAIYEFNIQGALTIRHVHNICYNKDYDRFLCCTGDGSTESHVIEINIDGTNEPSFVVKGTGVDFKWAGTLFYGAYVYYCLDDTPGQLKRCKYQDIGDLSKHEIILDNLPNDPIGLFIGERGDMLLTLTKYRSRGTTHSPFEVSVDQRRMYYSKDRVNFTDFIGDKETSSNGIYYGFNGVNAEGKIICGYWNDNLTLDNWNKLPSVSLDEMVKKAGFPMAFKPYDRSWEIVPVVDVLCDDVTVASGGSVTIQPKLFPVDASSLAFSIIDYDSSVVSVSGGTITGVAQGTTTAKVRSNLCYDAYAEITITVT